MKALERKKAVDKLAPTAEERKAMGRHRVAINKQNSLRHFMLVIFFSYLPISA